VVGNLITVLLQISSRLRHWKNFENRPVFDKVMHKILLVRFFSGHGVNHDILANPDLLLNILARRKKRKIKKIKVKKEN